MPVGKRKNSAILFRNVLAIAALLTGFLISGSSGCSDDDASENAAVLELNIEPIAFGVTTPKITLTLSLTMIAASKDGNRVCAPPWSPSVEPQPSWANPGCRDKTFQLNSSESFHKTIAFTKGGTYDGKIWIWVEVFASTNIDQDGFKDLVFREVVVLDHKDSNFQTLHISPTDLCFPAGMDIPFGSVIPACDGSFDPMDPARCLVSGGPKPCRNLPTLPKGITDPHWCDDGVHPTQNCPYCGDGQVQNDEDCEEGNLMGATCSALEWGEGTLTCSPNCRYDGSQCTEGPKCGNGRVEGTEECDGSDLNGATCDGFGLGVGPVLCNDDCTFDTSHCTNTSDCNSDGQCRPEEGENPVSCPEDCGINSLCAGLEHTCVTVESGEVFCWGSNRDGQCGDPNGNQQEPLPFRVEFLTFPAPFIKQVSCGARHTCAVDREARVWCWGANDESQLGSNGPSGPEPEKVGIRDSENVPVTVFQVTAGGQHTCALSEQDGTIYCWGANDAGQLGIDSPNSPVATPTPVGGASGYSWVSAGRSHTCAVDEGNALECWGQHYGRSPIVVDPGNQTPFPKVASGQDFSIALSDSGSAWSWGKNDVGQLGLGDTNDVTVPNEITILSNVWTIAAGTAHACAVEAMGLLYCWGSSDDGQLGLGNTDITNPDPTQVMLEGPVTLVAAGGGHTCAVLENGRLFCWGRNNAFQLGNQDAGNNTASPVPVMWR